MDKVSFYTYAQQNDFPIPKTFFLKNRVDAEAAAEQLSFPCIMKPPIKTPTWESNTRAKVFKVNDQKEFLVMYDQCSDWADLLMVQEWIDGNDADLYSCNCYFNTSSEPLVTFIARKLRQWPPETGTSCLGEECRNDVVLETSIRLLQSVNYHGLGYVEMKRDQRTGQHFIIEPNIGRPTGRSAIAEAGGVELLYTKYCDLANLPLPANREQKYEGVKWIYLMHDIQSSFYYWRRGELTFREWWRSIRGPKYFAVLSWNDPAPFWNHFWGAFLLVIKAQISRLVRNRKTSGAGFASTTGENP
jgi:predicted ATP-grasp superfamily ATP-dependent carboligase